MERTDLFIIIYLSSPEQQLIALQAAHVLQSHRLCSLCILTASRKVEPENQIKLEKSTLKAHFTPPFSSKMSSRKPPLSFPAKHSSKLTVADTSYLKNRIFTHDISDKLRGRSWCPFIQFFRNWYSLFLQEQTKQPSVSSRS